MSTTYDMNEEKSPRAGDASTDAARKIILGCVGRGMDPLGESGKYAVFHILKSEFALPSGEIAEDPQMFVSALQHVFGLGSKVLEESILEELYLVAYPEREFREKITAFARVLESDLRRDFIRGNV